VTMESEESQYNNRCKTIKTLEVSNIKVNIKCLL